MKINISNSVMKIPLNDVAVLTNGWAFLSIRNRIKTFYTHGKLWRGYSAFRKKCLTLFLQNIIKDQIRSKLKGRFLRPCYTLKPSSKLFSCTLLLPPPPKISISFLVGYLLRLVCKIAVLLLRPSKV